MKKKCLAFLLALVMCLSLLPAAVFADEGDETPDTPDTSVTDPVETPEPEPETPSNPDFVIENGVLIKCAATDKAVVIPDGVTSIGEKAFYKSWLSSVTIPGSVTSIGEWAFYNCPYLTSVTIQDGVTSIGDSAFYKCSSLTSVTIPNSVTSIGDYAFAACSSLTSVKIPSSVTSIGHSAFLGSGLVSISIPDSVTSLGIDAFNGCHSMVTATVGDGVTELSAGAFAGCTNLANVTFGSNVKVIGNTAFERTGLTSVVIPDGVTKIGLGAFAQCGELTEVTIPVSVTEFGTSTFFLCDKLTAVYYGGTRAQWDRVKMIGNTSVDGLDKFHYLGGEGEPEPQTVKVSFNSNGGSSVSGKTVTVGETYGSLPTPTREGYIFDGWYTSRTGGSRVTASTTVSNESDHTLYAQWTEADGKLTVSPSRVTFDKAQEGYTQPAAKTVTVTNIGEGEVTLTQPTASNFELGRLSATKLAPNASATFTVQPKAGLKPGTYTETITVKSTDGKTSAAVSVSFTVEAETPEFPDPTKVFTDLSPTGFYLDAVAWAVEKNITTGTTPTTFAPKENCTHGQILTFLWRAAGSPASNATLPFATTGKEYYLGAAKWAYEKGMIDKNFNHKTPCTRADAVNYIWQAFGKQSASYSGQFTDVPTNSPYATAVAWALGKGITTGTTDTTFTLNRICNRGEIVTFLYRAYK